MTKRVTHLSYSSAGGAGIVATRLSSAQKSLGWSAELLTGSASDLRSAPLEHPSVTLSAAVDEYLIKKPGFPSLFSSTRDQRHTVPEGLPPSDIYHLHWTNGLLNFGKATALRHNPVFWTLHDMNPFTGGCHHSFDCEGYTTDCSGCPAVRPLFQNKPPLTLQRKTSLYTTWPTLHVVTPSNWLAQKARSSTALSGVPVSVIPNPIDPRFFSEPAEPEKTPSLFPKDHVVVAVVAAQLDDPIKNVTWALEALEKARLSRKNISLVLVGSGGQGFSTVPGVTLTGPLDTDSLIRVLDHADAIVIPSLAENSPSVAYEAASRGVVPVVRRAGGLPEVVENLGVGHTVDSVDELAALLASSERFAKTPVAIRRKLAETAKSMTDPGRVAQAYVELYEAAL